MTRANAVDCTPSSSLLHNATSMYEDLSTKNPSEKPLSLEQKRLQLLPKLREISLDEQKRFGAPLVTEEDLIVQCAKQIGNAEMVTRLIEVLRAEARKRNPDVRTRHLSDEGRVLLSSAIQRVFREDPGFQEVYLALAKTKLGGSILPRAKSASGIQVRDLKHPPADQSTDIAA